MSTQSTNYLDIIERLPAGAKLELPDTAWDEYEHPLTQMESFHPGHRLHEVIRNSPAFPVLAGEDLAQYLEPSRVKGQSVALKAFRRMLRSRTPS